MNRMRSAFRISTPRETVSAGLLPGRPGGRPRRPVAALGLGLALLACGGEEAAAPPPLRPVRHVRVEPSGEAVPATFAGVARAGVESRLSFRVGGTVQEVAVKLGDRVDRGQVLARLDPTDYELKVEEAEAALAQGRAALRRAQADYDRVRALYENNNAARSELDAARAAAESAQAQVDAGGKQLQLARQQLGYTVLRAPLPGAIAEVEVEVNENVRAGDKVFLSTSGDRPEVAVAVPEVLIAQVQEGQPVGVAFDALPGRRFTATVTEVGVATTGTATTYAVTARLDEPGREVRAGMAAEVTFRFPGPDGGGRIYVPPVAVGEDREGRFVFVLEPRGDGTGVVRRRPVTVGELGPGGLHLEAGVEAGELVVTAGVRRLTDGMEVRVVDAPEDPA